MESLRKLDFDKKIKGDEARREVLVPDAHEDSSTELTYNLPSEASFRRGIINV